MVKKINEFRTNVSNETNKIVEEYSDTANSPTKIHYGKLEEGECISRLANSKFDTWAKSISRLGRVKVASSEENLDEYSTSEDLNKFFKPEFLLLLEKQYFPNIPIWSDLLMGNLKRHSENYEQFKQPFDLMPRSEHFRSAHDTVKVTAIAEARFNVLKNIDLNGQSQSRLDDFIGMLCESWKSIHRMVGESLLKSKKLRIAFHTKSVRQKPKNDLKEEWDKKKNQPFKLQKNKGKFQQAPKFPYPCQLLKENNAQTNVKSSSTPNLANDTRFENRFENLFSDQCRNAWDISSSRFETKSIICL